MQPSTQLCSTTPTSTTPSCSPFNVEQANDALTILLALGGAALGAILGYVGAALIARRSAREQFRNRLLAVRAELEVIIDEAGRRASDAPLGGVRRESPLPTHAWQMYLGTTQLELGPATLLPRLSRFYRLVEAANYLSSQAVAYLVIANLTHDSEIGTGYTQQAQEVAVKPFMTVSAEGAAVLDELESALAVA